MSSLPVELNSTICGGMTTNSGHMMSGWRPDGRISTAVSVASLSVDFSRVAVSHSPFPAICWKEVTHRSTATGVKNAVSVPCVAFVGRDFDFEILTALTWPEALQRIQTLLKQGLQQDPDFEKRWPEVLGTFLEAQPKRP